MILKTPVTILLVDDQPEKLGKYERILAGLGENLLRAASAREALDLLSQRDIAVLLIDIQKPDMHGYELVSVVCGDPRYDKTAIIVISGGSAEDVSRLKGYESAALDYVSAPIVPAILRAKVRMLADLYRKTQALEQLDAEVERRVQKRTEQTEAAAERCRESEERFRLLVENIRGYSISMLDPAGRVRTWNTGTERLYGYAAEEAQGRPISLFLPPEEEANGRADRLLAAAREGHTEDEGWRIRKDGSRFWANVVITPLYDHMAAFLGYSKIVHDLTERKRAEDEQAELLLRAEQARRESEEANQMKDEFLAVLSHELRTPLNAITGWAHMLQTGGLDPVTQAKAVETINRNALLQARLISDLLDVSRIVSGKLRLDFKPVDLQAVIRGAMDTLRPATEAKEIQINVDISGSPGPVQGDAFRLQQVVWNLLSNAIKFSPRKGTVEVCLRRNNPLVELTVQDEGPGIRPDFLPHIFEAFRQADSTTTRPHQGLGLGLAIVRNLLQLHGGRVKATNREDASGAIFKVELPLDLAPPLPTGLDRNAATARPDELEGVRLGTLLKGVRVLVVDDEADAREVVSLILDRCGAQVFVASSASLGFEILQRELPDVLVADIEMPGEDGYSLVRRVRKLPVDKGGSTIIIALTAHASASDIPKLVNAGFQRYVPKPLQPRDLITAIVTLTKTNREMGRESYSPSGMRRQEPMGQEGSDSRDKTMRPNRDWRHQN